MGHFGDRLVEAVRTRGNSICVGLDPRWERLPAEIRRTYGNTSLKAVAAAYQDFLQRVIDLAAPLVPVVKLQMAFFECCGPAGLAAMQNVIRHARHAGSLVILDGKRNDVPSTADAYAAAAFTGATFGDRTYRIWDADAVTINPYLGEDAVDPFMQAARREGGGVFVLVRTSNPGAGRFQDLECDGRAVYLHVAEAVANWAAGNPGQYGLGDVGAVVGATHPQELRQLRERHQNVWFLIPGYGAQGAATEQAAAGFRSDGLGAIINSSRGIISCFDPEEKQWESQVVLAIRRMSQSLREATPMGRL